MNPGPDMSVNIAGISMKNPVMVASGTFGYGKEYSDIVDINRLGAVTVKGLSLEPWEGNPTPRLVEVPGGIVNAIGLQNPGVQVFLDEYLPFLRGFNTPVIVNVWGKTISEYAEVSARLDGLDGIAALELNISCPNIEHGGSEFGADPAASSRLVSAVRKACSLPLIPKLPPLYSGIEELARSVAEAGADAVSLINSIPAMVIDIATHRPVLANGVGGLSGPAIHPVALRLVAQAARAVDIPVIGMGGITGPEDAVEFIIAGASAVAVGTANFTDPLTALKVVDGIEEYLLSHNIARLGDIAGSLETP
ncbi:MAG: dihydroorotate dehydrogenase [Kiritimatiellia bacterium]